MRKIKKCTAILTACLCILASLTGCGTHGEKDVIAQVKGNIDAIYLGKFNDDYLKMVEDSREELEQAYQEGLEMEAEYFANYWGIVDANYGESYADLNEDLKQDIIELLKEIYSHAKYDVTSAVEQSDGSYAVKVLVSPIDIMNQASELLMNEEYEPLNAFWEKYTQEVVDAMSEEEYLAYTSEYGEIIVQLVSDQLPNLGYMDQKSQSMQLELINNYWMINEDDFGVFDSYVIYYP